jgi:hypothetical protein
MMLSLSSLRMTKKKFLKQHCQSKLSVYDVAIVKFEDDEEEVLEITLSE